MIKNIKKALNKLFEPKYMDWEQYKEKIDTLSDYNFKQTTNKESIKNMPGAGKPAKASFSVGA